MDMTLVVMAAGLGSRYGGVKQIERLGPDGEILMEYAIYDALRAGFDRIVLIIKPQMLQDVRDLFGDRIEQRTGMRIDYAFQTPDRFTAAPLSQVAGLGGTSMPLHIPDVRTSAALASGLEETVDGISCTRSTGFVDVTAAGESKGMGLGRLAELLAERGMEVSEVAAVGDSWNDISMFEQADIPCAMAGAPGEVVEAAGGRTTPSVAAFIEALLA